VARRKPPVADPDALQQRISDLEALLVSPGWAVVCAEATTRYGARVFAETVVTLLRAGSAQQIGEKAIGLIAAREAAVDILSIPERAVEEYKRKLATQHGPEPDAPSPLGPRVEYSQ
jgi:hypothetical protein